LSCGKPPSQLAALKIINSNSSIKFCGAKNLVEQGTFWLFQRRPNALPIWVADCLDVDPHTIDNLFISRSMMTTSSSWNPKE
jgi:hypothetical protein